MTTPEYEAQVREAERALTEARSADDVRQVWRRYLNLGHRTLGRLLMGRTAEELLDRRSERAQRD